MCLRSKIALLVVFTLGVITVPGAHKAFAGCKAPAGAGKWRAATEVPEGAPGWVNLIHKCSPSYNHHEYWKNATWLLEVGHRCSRADCTWGRLIPRIDSNGVVMAQFATFIARRSVKISISGPKMKVMYRTDYIDETKKDVEGVIYMSYED